MTEPTADDFQERFGDSPKTKREAIESRTPLTGRWRHGQGQICCGTLRIARSDFDTNPSPGFQHDVLEWMCSTLNAATDEPRYTLADIIDQIIDGLRLELAEAVVGSPYPDMDRDKALEQLKTMMRAVIEGAVGK